MLQTRRGGAVARGSRTPQRASGGVVRPVTRRVGLRVAAGNAGRWWRDDGEDGAAGEPLRAYERITFVTAEGVVTIPGRQLQVPRPPRLVQPLPLPREQGLCIGATFSLAATNGRSFDRRINFTGFCQSLDALEETLEETVVSRGGEILEQERKLKSGVHEQLKLTVCVPFLWGVPPEVEALSAAIAAAGGVVDSVTRQWGIYRPSFRPAQPQLPRRQLGAVHPDSLC